MTLPHEIWVGYLQTGQSKQAVVAMLNWIDSKSKPVVDKHRVITQLRSLQIWAEYL